MLGLVVFDEFQQLTEILALDGIEAADGEATAQAGGFLIDGTAAKRCQSAKRPQAGDGVR